MMPSKLDAAAALESMDSMDALQSKPLTTIPDEIRPAFDYSGLDAQTVDDLHFAEKEYQHGKKLAERGLVHMGNAIAAAHDALCGTVVQQLDNGSDGACRNLRRAHNNQHCDDTFRAWCVSIGITKDTAYRLLQVAALMDNSSPRQQRVLKELSPSLLYAVAKPSAPAELVAQVKSGDITTHKQYQEALAQIKAEKERADAAEAERDKLLGAQNRAAWVESHIQDVEAQRDAALADVQGLTEQNAKLQQSYHDADESRIAANLQRQKAEAERDKAEARAKNAEGQLEGSRQVAEAAKLRGDKLKAENDALKSQPITAVVDEEAVDRLAGEKAYEIAADMTAEYKARQEQDARDAYDSVLMAGRSMLNTWQIAKPSLRKLPPEQREAAAQASEDVVAQREEALAKQLEEQRRKKAKLVDPLQYEMSIQAEDLAGYVPAFGWEAGPPSEQQTAALEKLGILPDAVESAGKASLLLDRLHKRREEGLTTPKQIRCLEKYGFQHVGAWSFEAARHMIDRISAQGWRGVPKGVNPRTYTPAAEPPAADSPFDFGW